MLCPPLGIRAALLDGARPPVTIARDPAREAAKQELSNRIYHQSDPNLVQRGISWFWDRVDDLVSAASGATPGGWVGIIVIIALVALAWVALWLRLGRPQPAPAASGALFDTSPRSAADHRRAAEDHARRGEWGAAVEERTRALVRGLEERALLDPRPGRTADEAATEAGRLLPGHASELRAAAQVFDGVRYGGQAATGAGYARITRLDTDVERTKPALAGHAAGGPR